MEQGAVAEVRVRTLLSLSLSRSPSLSSFVYRMSSDPPVLSAFSNIAGGCDQSRALVGRMRPKAGNFLPGWEIFLRGWTARIRWRLLLGGHFF